MKTVLCSGTDVPQGFTPMRIRRDVCSPQSAKQPLLSEIRQLGGEERMQGAEGALQTLRCALVEVVRQNPKFYGADDDPTNQDRLVSQLADTISSAFLLGTVEDLRRKAGFVKVGGCWVHRAVFTFVGFGLLAAAAVPLCAVSLMSTATWGWLPGALGIVGLVLLGIWILSRVRK